MDTPEPPFAGGVVVSPHHLASAAGRDVLVAGGNAVDAAIAANLVLGVVTPYHCGPGGDLFAIVWDQGDEHAYASAGRAPRAATPAAVSTAAGGDAMPTTGGLPVTPPGAVDGWSALVERFGTRTFGELAERAIRLARDGFVPSDDGAATFRRGLQLHGGGDAWTAAFGTGTPGERLVREGIARLYEEVAEQGRDAVYGGPIGRAIVDAVADAGGLLTLADLEGHEGQWVTPLRHRFRDLTVLELPPPTQGVTALQALAVAERLGVDRVTDPVARTHLLVEAARAALADRDAYVTDAAAMVRPAASLLTDDHLEGLVRRVDPARAGSWSGGWQDGGGTAYLCAADGDGMLVSLIQSNYMGFGSGVVVPEYHLNLQNRGASFGLAADDVNVIAPGKLPRHTLIPGMALRDGRPAVVFGTMGGLGQPVIHLQLLDRLANRDPDPQQAVAAPRWVVWDAAGPVAVEQGIGPAVVDGLRGRGHEVLDAAASGHTTGHAHAIVVTPEGYLAGTDPRTEGAACGLEHRP